MIQPDSMPVTKHIATRNFIVFLIAILLLNPVLNPCGNLEVLLTSPSPAVPREHNRCQILSYEQRPGFNGIHDMLAKYGLRGTPLWVLKTVVFGVWITAYNSGARGPIPYSSSRKA